MIIVWEGCYTQPGQPTSLSIKKKENSGVNEWGYRVPPRAS
jgi:hypothetical protein